MQKREKQVNKRIRKRKKPQKRYGEDTFLFGLYKSCLGLFFFFSNSGLRKTTGSEGALCL
jgi:hypothetical protein